MRYKHKGQLVHPMKISYLFPEGSSFLTEEAKFLARCHDDGIVRLYEFVSGAKTCIPAHLKVFTKTIQVPTYYGAATMYAIPTELRLDFAENIRLVVLSKTERLLDALCLQALGKLAGYLYLSWLADGVYERIAKQVCERDFPEQPPVSFNLGVAGVLEPYYKLAQFIKPTELAQIHDDFAFMIARAERFLSTPNRCWREFVGRTVFSLASFLQKQTTATGMKEVVLNGAVKAFKPTEG
jgi:hypothetical protein